MNKCKCDVNANDYGNIIQTGLGQSLLTLSPSVVDYCSTLKIIDQSNEKVCCSIFSSKLDSHPKVFKTGDIVRLHRVKVRKVCPVILYYK